MADVFQPKFVDLVRNITTTTGTANFALGPAAGGYSSFTAACAVGDSFYYSAIGIDRPGEREVGRGTLLAGGIVSRDPIGGTKMNFSNGAKSIALIAAAEWYEQAHAILGSVTPFGQALAGAASASAARDALGLGSAAVESTSRFPATFADRTALAAYAGGSAAYLREEGREGLFVWDPTDQSTKIAGDAAQGLAIAAKANGSGGSGAWVRKYSGPANVKWFGAKGDGTTDDSTAFGAAIVALKALATDANGFYAPSAKLFIPAGHYYLGTTTLDITHTLVIAGEGGNAIGGGFGSATKLRWAAGATGLRFQAYNTSGATAVGPSHTAGAFCSVRDLHLVGGYVNQATTPEGEYHGVHAKQRVFLENVTVEKFQGDGLYADGASSVNTNLSKAVNCVFNYNRDGRNVSGADANVWQFFGCSYEFNRRWGVNEGSAVGNVETGAHANGNGVTSENDGAMLGAAIVSYSASRYAVKAGQESGASTNPPSGDTTDNNWWYYVEPGGAASGRPAWTSGMTLRAGGAYYTPASNSSARNLFLGCYIESGEQAQVNAPAIVVGGYMSLRLKGTGVVLADYFGSLGLNGLTVNGNFVAQPGNNQQARFLNTVGGMTLQLDTTGTGLTTLNLRSNAGAQTDGYVRTSGSGGDLVLNGRLASRLRVNGASIVDATSTGAAVTGTLTATGKMGYATGAGGTVTQATSKATAVTINKASGQITTAADALAAGAAASFTVTNSQVASTDTIDLVLASGNATAGTYNYQVDKVGAGSFVVWIKNISAGSLSEALVFNFTVNKGVIA